MAAFFWLVSTCRIIIVSLRWPTTGLLLSLNAWSPSTLALLSEPTRRTLSVPLSATRPLMGSLWIWEKRHR